MAELVTHPLGVHLNQRHEEHIADCAIGGTLMKWFAANPIEGWYKSAYNPLRDEDPMNAGQYRGAALHTHFLDGPRVYRRVYGIKPSPAMFPDHLETISELQAALRGLGLSTAYTMKHELVDRLLKVRRALRPKILDAEIRRFAKSGRRPIDPDDDARIRLLYELTIKSPVKVELPDGNKLTLAQAFKNALTEVSIYWEDENGIRQRARFDLLKPNYTGDLKSILQWKASDFKQSLLREAVIRGYVLQWVHYDEARHQLRIAVDEGRVFGGNKTQRARLARIAEADEWGWLWVFCKMEGAPQVRGIVGRKETGQYAKAIEQRQRALDYILFYRELYGMENMWVDTEVVWEPAETDWPDWSVIPDAA